MILEGPAARGEGIDGRRDRLRIPVERKRVLAQRVDHDEKDVGPFRRGLRVLCACEQHRRDDRDEVTGTVQHRADPITWIEWTLMRRNVAAPHTVIAIGAICVRSALFLLMLLGAAGCAEQDRKPHVFLISVDTLRPDHLSMNGYARETSPNIDAFAAQAWNFPDAITPVPKTGPSFTTMFTGLPPGEHGVDKNPLVIPAEIPLLAEELAEAGYQTGAFVSNPVLRQEKGYARGFSTYVLEPDAGGVERVNDAFFEWAKSVDWDRPVFAWIHYMDPHGPYTPPAPFTEMFREDAIARADTRRVPLVYQPISGFPSAYVLGAIPGYQQLGDEDRAAFYIAGYDEEIRYMDASFGKLMQSLRDRGVYDGAAIALVADHGESLGDHDYWFEHGWFPFDDGLRIPFLVKPPGSTAGRSVPGSVTTLDVKPTLLAFPGLAPKKPVPGRDLTKSDAGCRCGDRDERRQLSRTLHRGANARMEIPAAAAHVRPRVSPFPNRTALRPARRSRPRRTISRASSPNASPRCAPNSTASSRPSGRAPRRRPSPSWTPIFGEKLRALGYTE